MTDRNETRAVTHADDCWSRGPAHYDCAVAEIERLRKLHQDAYQRGFHEGSMGLREVYGAIQEVKRQDAWGNAQLTEALLAAEDRAERVEIENAALTAENEKLRKDAERIEWLEEQTKKSRTGISFDWHRHVEDGRVVDHGYRFMRRHFASGFKDSLRKVIDAAMEGDKP